MDTEPGTKVVPAGEGWAPFLYVTFQLTDGNPEVCVCLSTNELADRLAPACSVEALEDLIRILSGELEDKLVRREAERAAADRAGPRLRERHVRPRRA